MQWLNVPHIQQTRPGWCLPACVAMVSAYLEQPLLQDDVALWLNTRGIGTPSSNIQRLTRYGFDVFYGSGSLAAVDQWMLRQLPPILFVRTGDLRPHWKIDTPHAVVIAGNDEESVALFDPGLPFAPTTVKTGNLMLAWSYSDYACAVISVTR